MSFCTAMLCSYRDPPYKRERGEEEWRHGPLVASPSASPVFSSVVLSRLFCRSTYATAAVDGGIDHPAAVMARCPHLPELGLLDEVVPLLHLRAHSSA